MKNLTKINAISILLIPIAILIGSIVLGIFYFLSQTNKQSSIERQQGADRLVEQRIDQAKTDQIRKDYIAKRKNECYSIYEKERNNWSNVKDSTYNETRDVCIVKYESTQPKNTEQKCKEITQNTQPKGTQLESRYFENYDECVLNRISKDF